MSAVNSMTTAQRAELKRSLQFIKDCDYKGTAVKVELEAQLDRPEEDSDNCCPDCEGDGYRYCAECEGTETIECESCGAEGTLTNPDNSDDEIDCPDCSGVGNNPCEFCDDGRENCETCNGSGYSSGDGENWDEERCRQFLLANVPATAREALIFSYFYNDGSVDSEFTFTLPIEKAQLAIYFIEAFSRLATEISGKCDTTGAGMHIAILNSESGYYPSGNHLDDRKSNNFTNAMTPLLPALFFLASATHDSRSLRYRPPMIVMSDKYGAISGSHNCFEYRVFETCYQRPLAFVDYMIVIAKSLQFYKDNSTNTTMKLGTLGFKDGEGIDRFYYTSKHLTALDKGLKWLKPDYKSIDDLKRERNFQVTEKALKEREVKQVEDWSKEFGQVKQRRRFERLRLYHVGLAEAYSFGGELPDNLTPHLWARRYVEKVISNDPNMKGDVKQYVKSRYDIYLSQDVRYRVIV